MSEEESEEETEEEEEEAEEPVIKFSFGLLTYYYLFQIHYLIDDYQIGYLGGAPSTASKTSRVQTTPSFRKYFLFLWNFGQ